MAAALALALPGCRPKLRRPAGEETPLPAVDAAALDRSVSPCLDFYRFACGRWIDQTPVPPDQAAVVRGQGGAEERSALLLRRVLEDAAAGRVDPRQRFGRKAGDYYAACADQEDVDARGLAELQAEWARLDAIEDRSGLADELSRLEGMGIEAPFRLRAGPDPADARGSLLVIGRGGLSLPTRELYLADDGPGAEARGRLLELLRSLLSLGGDPPEQAAAEAEAVAGLERDLAAAAEGAAAPARVERPELSQLAPGLPWDRLLRGLGADRLAALELADPSFASRVAELFAEAPLETWRAYLRWRLEEAMAARRALPAALVAEWFRLQRGLSTTAVELRPRWRHCVDDTVRAFGGEVGGAFGRRHLGSAARAEAARFAAGVVRAAEERVVGESWLDAASKGRAAAALSRLSLQVGYPDAEPDYGGLRVSRESYFRDVLAAGRFEVAREVERASAPAERGEWLLEPAASAPSYFPGRAVLAIPAGALQPPLYDREAPPAVVFGTAGVAIGRELGRALEVEGARAGADGWTAGSRERFEGLAACLARRGEPEGDGDAADLAGLRFALDAMQAARAAWPAPDRKAMGFTPEQQFFVGYAQSLCTSPGEGDSVLPGGQGRGPRRRVNGPLSDLPDFAHAFRCAEGTPMARPAADRCEVW